MSIKFVLEGEMPSKKNRWSRGKNGQVYIPADVKKELDDFLWQLASIRAKQKIIKPLVGEMRIEVSFYGQGEKKDLDNLFTTLLDLLQKGQIIKNDRYVKQFSVSMWKESRRTNGNADCEVTLTVL